MRAGGEPAEPAPDVDDVTLARQILRAEMVAAEPNAVRAQAAAQLWTLAVRYGDRYPEGGTGPVLVRVELPPDTDALLDGKDVAEDPEGTDAD